jgi:hypothetical protein
VWTYDLESSNPARFLVGFLSKFVGVIGVFERPFGMPDILCAVLLFALFSGSSMSVRGELVLFGGLPV